MALKTPFIAVEIETYKPGAPGVTIAQGYGSTPRGTLAELPDAIEQTGTILASDMGYRTLAADPGGVRPYPPAVSQAFALDCRLNLDPASPVVGAAWGTIELANLQNAYDAIAANYNCDGRNLRILFGMKAFDPSRGIMVDPAYATLKPLFVGVATPWFLSDTSLSVPIRDGSYWTERPLQSATYGGTGAYDGSASLAGTPKPKARGGTGAYPIRNITPVLIDPASRVYQYTDAAGTVVALYEGGYQGITFAGDTTNLYAGSTPAGQYRTDNSRGLFQLGSTPTRQITCDVTGVFPSGANYSTLFALAQGLLIEDCDVPAGLLDLASFAAYNSTYAFQAGVYFDGVQPVDGATAVGQVLGSAGALLTPTRSGVLRVGLLTNYAGLSVPSLSPYAAPKLSLDPSVIVSCVPRALPATLDPPPYRWRVVYQHNYTTQAAGLNPSLTAAQQQFLAAADRYQAAVSPAVQTAYRRPNDPAPVGLALGNPADALYVAQNLRDFWQTRRRVYDVAIPVTVGMPLDMLDIVRLTYPVDNLAGGQPGQIVGVQFRSQDSTITFQVLV